MTAPTDQFVEIATRTQEAITTAVRTWAETVQTVAGAYVRPELPDVQVAVDRYFDAAQQMLDNQRTFTKTFLTAGTQAAEAVTEQASRAAQAVTEQATHAAETVTTQTVHAAETAVGNATEAVKAVSEKTTATARAARNAAAAAKN